MNDLTRKFEIIELDKGATKMHCWYLLGPRGVVQFKAGPQSPAVHEISLQYPSISTFIDGWGWQPWDLGYHSPRPTYDGHEPISDSCEFLDGMACYYDGTSLGARDLCEQWGTSGRDDEVIWCVLAARYEDWLCNTEEEVAASPVTVLIEAMKRADS